MAQLQRNARVLHGSTEVSLLGKETVGCVAFLHLITQRVVSGGTFWTSTTRSGEFIYFV